MTWTVGAIQIGSSSSGGSGSGGGGSSGGGEHPPDPGPVSDPVDASSGSTVDGVEEEAVLSDSISYMITNLAAAAGATIATNGTTNSQYPIANVVDTELANPVIYTSDGTRQIDIDLGSAKSMNSVLIGGHNLFNGASITVKAGNSPSPTTVVGTATWSRDYIGVDLGSISARYVTLIITGGAIGDRIGQIGVGARIDFPGQWLLGMPFGQQEVTISQRTVRNVKHNYRLAKFEKREYSFRFRTAAEEEELRTFHRNTEGIITQFWLIEDITTNKLWYGNKEDNSDFVETEDKANPTRKLYRLQFEEASIGSFITT